LLVLVSIAAVCLAGGGAITLSSINTVPSVAPNYRWEPSSADTGGWLISWHDVPAPRGNVNVSAVHAYTSFWSNPWASPVEHRTPAGSNHYNNLPLMDSYLYWDPFRSKYLLAALDYGGLANSLWVQYSADSLGATWSTMNIAMLGQLSGPISWDFPSASVNPTNGRLVVGASKLVGGANAGYYTSYSTDGGVTWNGPYAVVTNGGATSRLVRSSSGFHVFIVNTTNPAAYVLMHWQSSDGETWSRQSDVATYGMPLPSSPSNNVCSGSTCGELSYAVTPDAVGSSGLGWVVAYPVNIGGYNAVNVSTELGGGVTINHTTDLLSADIATSSSGDWYLTYQTYSGGNRVLPLLQGVVYRTNAGSYLGAGIATIDPSQWWYFNFGGPRCSGNPCFAAGDFFRPAMNIYTGASVPMIVGSSQLNNLQQAFISDPQSTNLSQFIPKIVPFVQGSDLSSLAVLTSAHLAALAAENGRPGTSMMIYESMRQNGLVQ
jgi:hypothetical protein